MIFFGIYIDAAFERLTREGRYVKSEDLARVSPLIKINADGSIDLGGAKVPAGYEKNSMYRREQGSDRVRKFTSVTQINENSR